MKTIPFFTSINYISIRKPSITEKILSPLSNYFYLGGARVIVIKNDEVLLENQNQKLSSKTIALKIASYILLFPLTLPLFALYAALRSQHHFTVITPLSPEQKSHQEPVSIVPEQEKSVAIGPKQKEPVSIIPKQAEPVSSISPKQEEPVSISPKQESPIPPLSFSPINEQAQSTAPKTPDSAAIATAKSVENVGQPVIKPPSPLKEAPFRPFTIKISEESLAISSKEEMRLKAQEIGQQVLDHHVKLRIDVPRYGPENTQAMKFIEELKSVVNVISTRWTDIFYIVPERTEGVQENLTIRKYENGVIEEVQSSRESEGSDSWTYWEGRRIYPNGVIETGRFDDFRWHSGTRTGEETTTYRFPQTLVNNYDLDRGLMYADIEGEKRLIVIQKKPGSHEFSYDYVQVNEELIPTLAKILQEGSYHDFNKNKLNEVLSGPIDCQQFVQLLFDTHAIFSLTAYSFDILLEIIQEKKLIVNLRQQHPETKETFLDRYSKSANILKKLLAIDPTLIERIEGSEIAFVRALLSGNQKGASILFRTMEEQKIPLLPRELLFKKVAFSEGEVTLEELKSLSREDQEIVYQLANMYSQLDVVRTMHVLGFGRSEELLMCEGPSIFGCNMDALEMHECLQTFLTDLRSQKLLLTQTEFAQLNADDYIEKGSDIGRILGRNYIERKARELGLKHVKAPKKMIVIKDNQANLKLRTSAGLDIAVPAYDTTVYAERIQESNRKITAEETSELLRLFEATGFSDIHWGNIIIAKDGVYIIDTEFTNFWVARFYFENGRQYAEMAKIVHTLPLEQQEKFINELSAKIKTYQKHEEELEEQRLLHLKVEQAALQKSGCIYGPSFTFPVCELMACEVQPSKLISATLA